MLSRFTFLGSPRSSTCRWGVDAACRLLIDTPYRYLIDTPHFCWHAAEIVHGTFATLVKFESFHLKIKKTQLFCYVFSAALKRCCAAVIVRGTFAPLV